jgi:hypothetical protein
LCLFGSTKFMPRFDIFICCFWSLIELGAAWEGKNCLSCRYWTVRHWMAVPLVNNGLDGTEWLYDSWIVYWMALNGSMIGV